MGLEPWKVANNFYEGVQSHKKHELQGEFQSEFQSEFFRDQVLAEKLLKTLAIQYSLMNIIVR